MYTIMPKPNANTGVVGAGLQYTRSPFEFPSRDYESYQENGTKYLKCLKPLPEDLVKQLSACAGEIFLSGIPSDVRAERVATIASMLGEVYLLRFKVNFSGESRGFAYLQYINPALMPIAVARLRSFFRLNDLPMVRVRESRNSSKLLLKKTFRRSPANVYETLRQIISFSKLVAFEIHPGYFEYQIVFKCNEEAVHARRELLRAITTFGRNAIVVWDNHNNNNGSNSNNYNNMVYHNAIDLGACEKETTKSPQMQLPSNNRQATMAALMACL